MSSKANTNLINAKTLKNDEFYTLFKDIEDELKYYKDYFAGKSVYLPCDNPSHSNFWLYFFINFASLGLTSLTATYMNEKKSYKTTYDGKLTRMSVLGGDGGFDSKECVDIMEKADVIVTNPPFSKFKDFIPLLVTMDKKFLVIGNYNAVTYKEIFPLLQEDKLWFGHNSVKQFETHDGSVKVFGNIGWFTNIKTSKKCEGLKLTAKYDEPRYPKYCNCDAINIDRLSDIPCDYDGVMGVPVTIFQHYNHEQFKIIGTDLNRLNGLTGINTIPQEWLDMYFAQGGTGNYTTKMHSLVYFHDGKAIAPYKRILIQKICDRQ